MCVSHGPLTSRRPLVVPGLVALVVLFALGHAREARAQLPAGAVDAALADAAPAAPLPEASQLAEQAAAVSQAAGAKAAALQEQPVDVSLPAVPAFVKQVNDAAARADATNANTVTHELDQTQAAGAGDGSGGRPGQGQAAIQGARPSQAAIAQAVTVQNQPINIAIPVVVNSPNSHPVVTQTNNAGAAAAAVNTSSIVQGASQTQLGGAGNGGAAAPGAAPPASGAETTGSSPGGPPAQIGQESLGGPAAQGAPVWIWIWNWTWDSMPSSAPVAAGKTWPLGLDAASIVDELAAVVDHIASVADEVAPVAGEVTAILDAAIAPARPGLAGPPPAEARNAGGRSDLPAREPEVPSIAGGIPFGGEVDPPLASTLSSTFVQLPASERKRRERSTPRADRPIPPPPRHSAPAGAGGSGISPAGLVLGALLLLALQLASAAFALGRRFDLASAAWRRQAYLSPLERPG